ncbi:MAG: hypothetical protein ACOYEV_09985 [Candidatus Nanopelagicales bacterium]
MLHATFDRLMAADVKELAGLAADRHRLDNERVKLLQAHYADAVPLDPLKQEQARIGAELKTINNRIAAHHDQYAEARANLEDSIGLLAPAADIYRRCDDANRRLCNQAFLTAICIDDDDEPRVTYQRPTTRYAIPKFRPHRELSRRSNREGRTQTQTKAVTLVEGLNLVHSG